MRSRWVLVGLLVALVSPAAQARVHFMVTGGGPDNPAILEIDSEWTEKACADDLEMPTLPCRKKLVAVQKTWQQLYVACPDQPLQESYAKYVEAAGWGHSMHLYAALPMALPAGQICLATRKRAQLGAGLASLKAAAASPLRTKLSNGAFSTFRPESALLSALAKLEEEVDSADSLISARQRFREEHILVAPVGHRKAVGVAVAYLDVAQGEDDREPSDWSSFHVAVLFDGEGKTVEVIGSGWSGCGPGKPSAACVRVIGVGDVDGDGRTDLLVDDRGDLMLEMGSVGLHLSRKNSYKTLGSWFGG